MSAGINLKSYYTLLLVQQLGFSKQVFNLSQTANLLQSLIALAHVASNDEDEKKEYEHIMQRLAELQLELKELEVQLREIDAELYDGNMLYIPLHIKNKYSKLITELRKIEALVISRLDDLLGDNLPVQAIVPVGVEGKSKGKKSRGVVEDDLDEFLD